MLNKLFCLFVFDKGIRVKACLCSFTYKSSQTFTRLGREHWPLVCMPSVEFGVKKYFLGGGQSFWKILFGKGSGIIAKMSKSFHFSFTPKIESDKVRNQTKFSSTNWRQMELPFRDDLLLINKHSRNLCNKKIFLGFF